MKIAIIGAGKIGSTLGKKWAIAGHEIRFGVRNPLDQKYSDLLDFGAVLSINEAINAADVVLICLPGSAMMNFATQHGAALAGKFDSLVACTGNGAGLWSPDRIQNVGRGMTL